MPGEDENQAALERADAVARMADNIPEMKLETMKEMLRAELADDKATAIRRGKEMNLDTVDIEQLARMELTRREARRVTEWKHPDPPKGWRVDERDRGEINVFYRNAQMRLMVGLSCEVENDGRAYIHLSVSHAERIPTWGEMGKVKEAFLGDLEAYQVLPPRARYVNIDPRVLNLYAPLNGPVLPDFTRGTGGI